MSRYASLCGISLFYGLLLMWWCCGLFTALVAGRSVCCVVSGANFLAGCGHPRGAVEECGVASETGLRWP